MDGQTDERKDGRSEGTNQDLAAMHAQADTWMLTALGATAAFAVGIGFARGQAALAAACAAVLFIAGTMVYIAARGSRWSRAALPVLLMSMVALHIHLGAGQVQYHFGVFVALAFLLLYRDWRALAIGAATIAVHHVAFDRLQAAGLPGRVTALIGALSRSADAQAVRVTEVDAAIGRLAEATQANASLAEDSGDASRALRDQARRLAQVVEVFALPGRQGATRTS